MKTSLLALALSATLTAVEPTSELLKNPQTKDTFSYFMIGAAVPIHKDALEVIAPNLSYGMRHFSGMHAKDYFVNARVNRQLQTITGQYSFLFFPIIFKGLAKTHSAPYLGLGLSAGASYLSKSTAEAARHIENDLLIKNRIKQENVAANPERIAQIADEVNKNQRLRRISPSIDLPLTVGYQFANTNFIQAQFSTVAYLATKYYDLPGNGVYATINYGFGF